MKRERGVVLDYVSILHTQLFTRCSYPYGFCVVGAHAICEKPFGIESMEFGRFVIHRKRKQETKFFTILQLRLHPSIIALKEKNSERSKRQNTRGRFDLFDLSRELVISLHGKEM